MKEIIIKGLGEYHISKLLPKVDYVELGYTVITGIMLIPQPSNKTQVIFLGAEKYNRTFPVGIDGIFKILS